MPPGGKQGGVLKEHINWHANLLNLVCLAPMSSPNRELLSYYNDISRTEDRREYRDVPPESYLEIPGDVRSIFHDP